MIYDVRHGLRVPQLQINSIPSQLSWSSTGNTLAFFPSSNPESVTFYTPKTDQLYDVNVFTTHNISPDTSQPIVWAPDDSAVAFVAFSQTTPGAHSTKGIYRLDVATHDLQLITVKWDEIKSLRWSPDGQHLAFSSDDRVYVALANTANEPRLIGDGTAIAWAAQASMIMAYSETKAQLGALRLDAEPVYMPEQIGVDAQWSRDGTALVFSAFTGTRSSFDVWMYTLEDATIQPIATTSTYEGQPTFSIDGKWIAYVATLNGRDNIVLYNVDRKQRFRIRGTQSRDWNPAWRP
jgi:Tol biopolymer transport system component